MNDFHFLAYGTQHLVDLPSGFSLSISSSQGVFWALSEPSAWTGTLKYCQGGKLGIF